MVVDPLNVMVSGGSSDMNSLMDDKIKIIMTVSITCTSINILCIFIYLGSYSFA